MEREKIFRPETISLNEILSKTRNGKILGQEYWEEHCISVATQWELLEDYPCTFIREFPWINACEKVIIEMIKTRRKSYLEAVIKKALSRDEQLTLIEYAPEWVHLYQSRVIEIGFEPDFLTEEAEQAYIEARKENPSLPEIPLYW